MASAAVSTLRTVARIIDGLNEGVGRAVSWLTLLMVLVIFVVVVLRYGFDEGAIGLQEAALYMYAFVFMLGSAYALKHDGHVRVDVLYNRMPPRGKAWVDLLGSLLCLVPMFVFIFYSSLDYVGNSWRIREASWDAGGLPYIYVLKTAIPALAILMLLQGVSQAIKALLVILGHDPQALPHTREAQDQI